RVDAPGGPGDATPGGKKQVRARGVTDASGTYGSPNPLGANGTRARGEDSGSERIFYGIADVLGRDRARYSGKRVAVVGSGHSAFDVLIDLAELARTAPRTGIVWVVRRPFADTK